MQFAGLQRLAQLSPADCTALGLRRPGECIVLPLPDTPGRAAVLQAHCLAPSITVASVTVKSITVTSSAPLISVPWTLPPACLRGADTPALRRVTLAGEGLSRAACGALQRLLAGLCVAQDASVASRRVIVTEPLLAPRAFGLCTRDTVVEAVDGLQARETRREGDGGAAPEVAGVAEALEALCGLLRLPLERSAHLQHLQLQCPRGLLLHGPPGCGKTALVRAASAQCRAVLISV